MSILIYAESWNGKFKKSSFEAVSYGVDLASKMNTEAVALVVNADDATELQNYGVSKIISVSNQSLKEFASNSYADLLKNIADKEGTHTLVMLSTSNVNSFAPALSIAWNASLATGVIAEPSALNPFTVNRKVFSNKAHADVVLSKENKVLVIAQNSYGVKENVVSASVEEYSASVVEANVKSEKVEVSTGKINLMDAEKVVSAGRGLKAPENWTMIEELAEVLNAATACSKPVSDIGWRSHNEHVGQTGKNIAPDLYFAIGISGAIQHVAGINSSKIIVAINTDDEAPIFKAADYGIVGDAFDVVPKLIAKIKELKE
ncbi:MAG: electron transfer flavoprotein subunit alpha/FixB family protein [Ichthyobacteriaceae bacterium]|nr:electron transfer flavoprotein subunit alpha/FixB family protein [Ichthyobacteriaceae bacterium]